MFIQHSYRFTQCISLHSRGDIYLSMDIEFIELEHRADITAIMQVCGITLETAYHLYHRHHCNLQAALAENLGLASPLSQQQRREEAIGGSAMAASFDEDNDPQFNRYCQFMENGVPFFKKYPIKNAINTPPNSTKPPKPTNLENLSFKKDLEESLKTRLNLKIEAGQVADGLAWSWRERFPIAVLVLNLENLAEGVKEALTNQVFIGELCTYFKLYAIDPQTTALPTWLSPFISPQDNGSIVVMRVSCMDDIQTVAKVKLQGTAPNMGKSLQKAKSSCIQREYDQAHLVKQHAIMRNRGGGYRRPPSTKERIKMKEDARLRRQQDEEFLKACMPKQQKKEEDMKEQIKQPKKEEYRPSTQQLKQTREQQRKEMTIYSQGLRFKMRMPSGKNQHLFVRGDQTVQYLFDYVNSCPEQIGFERDYKRSFDIVYGPEKNKYLLAVKSAKIVDILQDAEFLIVKELDQ